MLPLIWVELEEGGRRYDLPCEPVENHRIAEERLTESRICCRRICLWAGIGCGCSRRTGSVTTTPWSSPLRRLPQAPRGWGLGEHRVVLGVIASSGGWGISRTSPALGCGAAHELGADFVLVNPLHAAALVTPMENSPYSSPTRRFGHPIYIRPEKIEHGGRPPTMWLLSRSGRPVAAAKRERGPARPRRRVGGERQALAIRN